MSNNDGKFMVNLKNQERWYGDTFDTVAEAMIAGRNALKNKELDNDIFGERLETYTIENMGINWKEQDYFMIGRAVGLKTPKNMARELIDWLDDSAWIDTTYSDDYPSQYVFGDDDVKELDKLLTDFIQPKVEKSNYYIVEIIGEIPVVGKED